MKTNVNALMMLLASLVAAAAAQSAQDCCSSVGIFGDTECLEYCGAPSHACVERAWDCPSDPAAIAARKADNDADNMWETIGAVCGALVAIGSVCTCCYKGCQRVKGDYGP